MELLRELCECSGIPGREERLREVVRRELEPLADDVTVDALGNLIARKAASEPKGKKKAKAKPKRLMIAAHMDEIGFVVSHIDDKGWLRLVPVGGHNPRNMVAQRVLVCTAKGDLPGLLYPGVKPPHIATPEDLRKELKVSDFFVDLCLPADKVKKQVELGSMVVIQRDYTDVGDGASCKAMDSSFISHRGLVECFKSLARKRKIAHQMEILPRGGTDAGAIQRVHAGVPVITLSVPTRYIHTSIELVHNKDVEAAVKLLTAFIEDGTSADLGMV
jgi:endoglucanase